MSDNSIDSMIDAMKEGIDANSTEAPVLSLDPKTSQVSVVGDPNKIEPTKGDYDLTFSYAPEALTDEDKARMKYNEDTGEYEAVIHYHNRRVRPLYRTTVSMDIADILTKAKILLKDGSYTTDTITNDTVRVFLDNIQTLARVARVTLGIEETQMEFVTPDSLIGFFVQMMFNEPNLVKEASGFLEPFSTTPSSEPAEETKKKTPASATPQN